MNIIKQSIMWSSASFCSLLMLMLNKYLEGTIYLNVLIDGIAGILGTVVATPIYTHFKLRSSFLFSFGVTLIGGLLIFLFQSDTINPNVAVSLGLASKTGLPETS